MPCAGDQGPKTANGSNVQGALARPLPCAIHCDWPWRSRVSCPQASQADLAVSLAVRSKRLLPVIESPCCQRLGTGGSVRQFRVREREARGAESCSLALCTLAGPSITPSPAPGFNQTWIESRLCKRSEPSTQGSSPRSRQTGHRYSFRMGLKPNAKVGTSAARSVLHRALHSLLQPTMRRIRDCQAAPFHGQRHPPLLGIGSAAGGSMTRF